jgi:hypothetical protein
VAIEARWRRRGKSGLVTLMFCTLSICQLAAGERPAVALSCRALSRRQQELWRVWPSQLSELVPLPGADQSARGQISMSARAVCLLTQLSALHFGQQSSGWTHSPLGGSGPPSRPIHPQVSLGCLEGPLDTVSRCLCICQAYLAL